MSLKLNKSAKTKYKLQSIIDRKHAHIFLLFGKKNCILSNQRKKGEKNLNYLESVYGVLICVIWRKPIAYFDLFSFLGQRQLFFWVNVDHLSKGHK